MTATDELTIAVHLAPLALRRYLIKPVVALAHRHLPTWVALVRCRRRSDGWLEIPSSRVAVHVGRRIVGCAGVTEDYLIRVERGRATAIGWIKDDGTLDFEAA